jgi:acyl carrier protein
MSERNLDADELARRVVACLAAAHRIPREEVHVDSRLEQLHIDSVDAMCILFALEEEFNISIPQELASRVRTVCDIVDGIRYLRSTQPAA